MMKYVVVIILLLAVTATRAQTSLKFCVQVDSSGVCASQTNEFDVGKKGGIISFLVSNADNLNLQKLRYKIYYLEVTGKETLNNTIEQTIQTGWSYAWKDVMFYDAGTYKVKVYNVTDSEDFLCSEILKIFSP